MSVRSELEVFFECEQPAFLDQLTPTLLHHARTGDVFDQAVIGGYCWLADRVSELCALDAELLFLCEEAADGFNPCDSSPFTSVTGGCLALINGAKEAIDRGDSDFDEVIVALMRLEQEITAAQEMSGRIILMEHVRDEILAHRPGGLELIKQIINSLSVIEQLTWLVECRRLGKVGLDFVRQQFPTADGSVRLRDLMRLAANQPALMYAPDLTKLVSYSNSMKLLPLSTDAFQLALAMMRGLDFPLVARERMLERFALPRTLRPEVLSVVDVYDFGLRRVVIAPEHREDCRRCKEEHYSFGFIIEHDLGAVVGTAMSTARESLCSPGIGMPALRDRIAAEIVRRWETTPGVRIDDPSYDLSLAGVCHEVEGPFLMAVLLAWDGLASPDDGPKSVNGKPAPRSLGRPSRRRSTRAPA